jgi:hypothetical protein
MMQQLLQFVLGFALSSASFSVLRVLRRRTGCRGIVHDTMKIMASILFSVGHYLQCHGRPLDSTDWSYILGCTPFLTMAFAGKLLGRPDCVPLMQFLSGLFLLFSNSALYKFAKKARASVALPLIGITAALLLMVGGILGTLLRRQVISEYPGFSPVGVALLTALVFGVGNVMKLAQILARAEPKVGQVCKVLASLILITSNTSLLAFRKKLAD